MMAIPYGVSLDGFFEVIAAWNRARGCDRPLRMAEVGRRIRGGSKAESKEKLASNQSTFLIQIGILKKEGTTNRLTKLGCEIAKWADYDQQDRFVSTMRSLLLQWHEGRPLIEYLHYREQVSREELLQRVIDNSGKSMGTTNAAMGGKTLIDLLERVGIVLIGDDDNVRLAQGIFAGDNAHGVTADTNLGNME